MTIIDTSAARSERLTQIADATVAAITADPTAATLQVSVTGTAVGSVATDIRARTHQFFIDEPAALGGEDTDANPVEYALASLIACHVVTYRFWAARLGIELTDITVGSHGDLDIRGFFGAGDVRAGFSQIQLTTTLTGPDTSRFGELADVVSKHCPILDLFANGTQVTTSYVTTQTAAA